MRKSIATMAALLLAACGGGTGEDADGLDITAKFNSTWNIYETIERDGDGVITYGAIPWGGLVGTVTVHNLPADWTPYEAVTVEFAEPTTVETQLLVADRYKAWGKVGVTSLTCNFDGQDVTSVQSVMLQTPDSAVIKVKCVRLTFAESVWTTTPLRTLDVNFGDWANGFVLQPQLFAEAEPGDKLEFIYTTDTSDPNVGDWLVKTIYNGTDSVLEGNESELNQWQCAPVGRRSTIYRIALTENDVAQLKEKGAFVNGRYLKVTQCNLLRKEELWEGRTAGED